MTPAASWRAPPSGRLAAFQGSWASTAAPLLFPGALSLRYHSPAAPGEGHHRSGGSAACVLPGGLSPTTVRMCFLATHPNAVHPYGKAQCRTGKRHRAGVLGGRPEPTPLAHPRPSGDLGDPPSPRPSCADALAPTVQATESWAWHSRRTGGGSPASRPLRPPRVPLELPRVLTGSERHTPADPSLSRSPGGSGASGFRSAPPSLPLQGINAS